jgi:hypothetical protein
VRILVLGIGFAQECLMVVRLLKMILLQIIHFSLILLWAERVVQEAVHLMVKSGHLAPTWSSYGRRTSDEASSAVSSR